MVWYGIVSYCCLRPLTQNPVPQQYTTLLHTGSRTMCIASMALAKAEQCQSVFCVSTSILRRTWCIRTALCAQKRPAPSTCTRKHCCYGCTEHSTKSCLRLRHSAGGQACSGSRPRDRSFVRRDRLTPPYTCTHSCLGAWGCCGLQPRLL